MQSSVAETWIEKEQYIMSDYMLSTGRQPWHVVSADFIEVDTKTEVGYQTL